MVDESNDSRLEIVDNFLTKARIKLSKEKTKEKREAEIALFVEHDEMKELVDMLNELRKEINLKKAQALAAIDAEYAEQLVVLENQYAAILVASI